MMIINRQCILLNIYYVTSYPNRDSSVCGCGRAAAAVAAVADEEGFRDAGAWSETFMGIEWGGGGGNVRDPLLLLLVPFLWIGWLALIFRSQTNRRWKQWEFGKEVWGGGLLKKGQFLCLTKPRESNASNIIQGLDVTHTTKPSCPRRKWNFLSTCSLIHHYYSKCRLPCQYYCLAICPFFFFFWNMLKHNVHIEVQ